MSTPEHDVEYRLDADHIRAVCRAEQPDGSINVTQVDGSPHEPPYVTVDDLDFPYSVNQALRKVGYTTHRPDNSNTIVVNGWSTTRLNDRAAALAGLLSRWRDTETAVRAVDIYALTHHRWTPPMARDYASSTALLVQEFEAKLVTGPHATHAPHIRPPDDDQARLLADNQRLEKAVAAHLDQARRVAGYAIDTYTQDLNAEALPTDARAWAITAAMNRYSAETRRDNVERRTGATAPPTAPKSASSDHPADHPVTVAANDQPTGPAPRPPTASPDAAGARPQPPRGRTP